MIELFADKECTQPLTSLGYTDDGVAKTITIFIRNSSANGYNIQIILNFPFAQVAGDSPNLIRPQEILPLTIKWTPDNIVWNPDEEFRVIEGEMVISRRISLS